MASACWIPITTKDKRVLIPALHTLSVFELVGGQTEKVLGTLRTLLDSAYLLITTTAVHCSVLFFDGVSNVHYVLIQTLTLNSELISMMLSCLHFIAEQINM